MKYNELHRKLRKIGCYETGRFQSGHPVWFSPITNKEFTTSHHGSEEVAKGTLKSIVKSSGLKL